jgi:hypothetical protein
MSLRKRRGDISEGDSNLGTSVLDVGLGTHSSGRPRVPASPRHLV